MKVDIRREQYNAYYRDHKMAGTQQTILHYVNGALGDPPVVSQPVSYARWSKYISHYPWVDLERSLYRPPPTVEANDDEEDEDEDDVDGDDEDEESSHSQDAALEHLHDSE